MLALIKEFKDKSVCKIREFAQFVGNMTACCPAVEYGRVYSKLFEKQIFLALLDNHDNYDAKMMISRDIQDDFTFWERNISQTFMLIKTLNFRKEIFSDASTSGWGAYCDNELVHGFWKNPERNLFINHLELLAAFLALKRFAESLSNCEI